jgi:hypothetical protein
MKLFGTYMLAAVAARKKKEGKKGKKERDLY